jgi:hypothetical protein
MRSYSTSELSRKYNVPVWRIRRALDTLVALGVEVQRIGGYRALRGDQLPALEAELRRLALLGQATPASE